MRKLPSPRDIIHLLGAGGHGLATAVRTFMAYVMKSWARQSEDDPLGHMYPGHEALTYQEFANAVGYVRNVGATGSNPVTSTYRFQRSTHF